MMPPGKPYLKLQWNHKFDNWDEMYKEFNQILSIVKFDCLDSKLKILRAQINGDHQFIWRNYINPFNPTFIINKRG